MKTIITNDYTIEFYREKVFLKNKYYEYKCFINILDLNGIPKLKLVLNENDIAGILENIYNFYEFDYTEDLYITNNLTTVNLNYLSFNITFYSKDEAKEELSNNYDNCKIVVDIYEYNPTTDYESKRFNIVFGDENFMQFAIELYNELLKGIDKFNYLSPDFLH